MGRYLEEIKKPENEGVGNRQNRQNPQKPSFVSFVGSSPILPDKILPQDNEQPTRAELASLVRLCGE